MTKIKRRKDTLTYSIEQMKVGEKREYPAERYLSVTALASSLGFKMNRKYTSAKNKEKRTVTITRTA